MSFDYSGLEATASKLIKKFGRTFTLRTLQKSGTAYNPTVVNSDQSVKGAFTKFASGEIDGNLIQSNDKMVLIDSAVVPTVDQLIVDGSQEYSIVNIVEIKPGDTGLIYKVQVRRG